MNRTTQKIIRISIFIVLIVMGILILSIPGSVKAQVSTPEWSEPVNLSQSGSTDDPVFVINTDGSLQVLWRDLIAGFVSSKNVSGVWSTPAAADFPFEDFLPTLIADNSNYIHAFWLNDSGELVYSKIAAANFGIANTWTGSIVLSDSAIDIEAATDALGNLHLVYLRVIDSETQPAGIYYTRSTTDGTSWETATPLYQSPYLRSVTKDQANLKLSSSIQADQNIGIYLSWDNLPLRRVFLIKSNDGGQTWEPMIEIDGPRNTSGLSAPFNLEVASQGENVVLTWLMGQRGVNCSQYSKYSNDGGQTWSENQQIFDQLSFGGCPEEIRLVGYTDSYATLMTNTQGQIFLSAWNGSDWSDPQLQTTMGGIVDPTTMANVDLRCQNVSLYLDQIMVVGCDRSAGKDIWFLQRNLGDLTAWFPSPSAWKTPTTITNSVFEFQSLQAVANGLGEVHSLWMQPDGIYYAFWAEGQWIQPTKIIKSIFNDSDQMATAIDQEGLLYLVWTSSQTGEILFSWANSSKATDSNEWASPQVLPSPKAGCQSPDIVIDETGTVFVIYSIPINEERGIYLVRTDDRGISWSKPQLIFDAAKESWEMVDQSRVGIVSTDFLVTTWAQTSLNNGPLELYFSGFAANTENPEAANIVSKPVIWNDLIGFGENTVYRVWQELDNNQPEMWSTYSTDQGQTWEQPFYISSIGEVPGPSNISMDRSGQLHLIYFFTQDEINLGIKHWIWNGKNWFSDEGISLGDIDQREVGSIASTINSNDEIFTIFSISDEGLNHSLMFTQRYLEIPGTISVTSPESNAIPSNPEPENLTATPTSTASAAAEVNAESTATPNLETNPISNQPAESSNSLMGLVLGIGLAFGLVATAFIFRLVITSRKQ